MVPNPVFFLKNTVHIKTGRPSNAHDICVSVTEPGLANSLGEPLEVRHEGRDAMNMRLMGVIPGTLLGGDPSLGFTLPENM